MAPTSSSSSSSIGLRSTTTTTLSPRILAIKNLLSLLVTLDNAKSAVFWYLVYSHALSLYRTIRAKGGLVTVHEAYLRVVQWGYNVLLKLPQARSKLESEMARARAELKKKLVTDKEDSVPGLAKHARLPAKGTGLDELQRLWSEMDKIDKAHWEEGKVSGAIYHGHTEGAELGKAINEAIQRHLLSNPLHPDVFPGVRKMEAELISMTLSLFHGDSAPSACGTTTSGGTESIVMACKAYRDYARAERGVRSPEMIVPISAHAAFYKAAQYFGIKLIEVPVHPVTRKVDLARVRKAINGNTIMLVGSAPNFPDGIVDPIPELSALAVKYKIPLHVDCCLGSFIVPFLDKAGYGIGDFDFKLPGVTSISCDTHKYGFAPKGSSIIMYSDRKYRNYQFFTSTSWPGGVYASPSLAGSRPGALLAGAWAALLSMGEEGYLESCKSIVGAARRIEAGIREKFSANDELQVLGEPKVTVVAFKSDTLDVLQVGDKMSEKGWHLNALQNPPSLHICCTRLTVPAVDRFLSDLRSAVDEVKTMPAGVSEGTMVQIYGLGKSPVSGPFIVSEFAKLYLDVLYDL